jgi:hypothetical protein
MDFRRWTALALSMTTAITGLEFSAAHSATRAEPRIAWMKLFDGKDMNGWAYDSAFWSADGGMILGQGKATFNTFCNYNRKFSDFVLAVKARHFETPDGYTNSGIQYRSAFIDSAKHRMQGYQSEIGEAYDGAMYPENGYPADAGTINITPECKASIKRNDWNQTVITADGNRIKHQLNGLTCLEYTASVKTGYIGLQLHATTLVMKVDFRDLYIRPLNGSFVIPDSLAAYLDDGFSDVSANVIDRAILPQAMAGLRASRIGNRLLLSSESWIGNRDGVDISLIDPQGRLRLSRRYPSAGAYPLEFILPPAASGNFLLRASQSGGTVTGAIRVP